MSEGGETVFQIFRNRVGRWCARRADGLVSGTFFHREAALRFARRECRDVGALRLTFSGPFDGA
ncbi:MAG: hypothetical protein WDM81_00260 [Rhizomicrobium sp.]